MATHGDDRVALPTGRVVACDPLVMHDLFPFTVRVPEGQAEAFVLEVVKAPGRLPLERARRFS